MIIPVVSFVLSIAGAVAVYVRFRDPAAMLGCSGFLVWAVGDLIELGSFQLDMPPLIYETLPYVYTLGYLLVIFSLATVPLATAKESQPARKRPRSVTIIAILMMVSAAVGLAGALTAADQVGNATGLFTMFLGLSVLSILHACIGFGLLVGKQWTRTLFFILYPIGAMLDLYAGVISAGIIIRGIFYVVGVYYLTRLPAREFFRLTNKENS